MTYSKPFFFALEMFLSSYFWSLSNFFKIGFCRILSRIDEFSLVSSRSNCILTIELFWEHTELIVKKPKESFQKSSYCGAPLLLHFCSSVECKHTTDKGDKSSKDLQRLEPNLPPLDFELSPICFFSSNNQNIKPKDCRPNWQFELSRH